MKNWLTSITGLLMFLLVAGSVQAQDRTATRILEDVSKTYKSYKSIKARFKITINNQQSNSVIKQNGTLYLKGKKFRIDMSDQEIYCDGKTMWTYFKEENEVQISKYEPGEQEINPSEIFSIYQKGFDYKYTGESMLNGKKVQNVELIPQDKNKPFFKVKLMVDKLSHKIVQMKVLNKNGVSSTYEITSFAGNVNITDSFFKFNEREKPGVVKIDLTK